MNQKQLSTAFFAVLLLEMLAEVLMDFQGIPYGIWLLKPLLMPILMIWYYRGTKGLATPFDKIVMAALFFSWWGDNFLMPDLLPESISFLLGLGSFLIAHIMYVVAFSKTNINETSILKKRPHLALVFLLFGLSLVMYLKREAHPDFLPMQIPVMVYATVIMVMVIMSINRYNKVNHDSFKWVVIGALLFMFSDSLIALSRFSSLFDNTQFIARLMIMPLYALGQFLIAKGCLLQNNHETADEGN